MSEGSYLQMTVRGLLIVSIRTSVGQFNCTTWATAVKANAIVSDQLSHTAAPSAPALIDSICIKSNWSKSAYVCVESINR